MENLKLKIQNSGFTLIEIIVATSIFTVVMLITMGALLTLNDSSRKAQALRTVIDNLNFAVEDMNRKIRTGDLYHCYTAANLRELASPDSLTVSKDCSGDDAGVAISVKVQDFDEDPLTHEKFPVWVAYKFEQDANGVGSIKQKRSLFGGRTNLEPVWSDITAPEVDIKKMDFRVIGSQDTTTKQPMILLNISGIVDLQKERLRTDFSLQTAISRRGTGTE